MNESVGADRLREHSRVPSDIGPYVEDVVAFMNKGNHDICFGRPKGANRVEIADAFERLEEGIRHES